MVDSRHVSLTEAIDVAASRLLSSQRTLITGLVSTTLDTIKIACSLAECIFTLRSMLMHLKTLI